MLNAATLPYYPGKHGSRPGSPGHLPGSVLAGDRVASEGSTSQILFRLFWNYERDCDD